MPDQNAVKVTNAIKKSINSFKEIAHDVNDGFKLRGSTVLENPSLYNVTNYMSLGILDSINTGAKNRADKMSDSKYDFANWASVGIVGMVDGAVNPTDPLSKEHWENSFGTVLLITGPKPNITTGMDAVTTNVIKGLDKAVSINPNEIRFSQSSVNGAEEIIQSMKANGWKGDPIDVIKMSDGKLTTIDNTRVVAAREARIEVKANIHDANEPG